MYHIIYNIRLALLGFSSGSAGGEVLGEFPEKPKTPERSPDPPATQEQVPVTGEKPPVSPIASVSEPQSSVSALETELKERMYKHMAALEKEMTNEFMEKKRKAESDLEVEINLKREKRMRDLEEDLSEEKRLKETHLARLECQLSERMQLVSDEQALIDELKEKSRELQKKLADEQAKLQNLNSVPATPVVETPMLDEKDRAKELLKLKIQQTVERSREVPAAQQTPSPPNSTVSGAGDGSGLSSGGTPTSEPTGVIVPITDMRFTSSTHPGAWHFLYRVTRREDQCDKEIYDQWHAGGKILYTTLVVFYKMTSMLGSINHCS